MSNRFTVQKEDKLLNFLFNNLSTWSKKRVKERLRLNSIYINGKATTKHDFALNVGDIVEVSTPAKKPKENNQDIKTLEILYQDEYIIAINKPHGLLSVATTKENKQHALAILRAQLSGKKRKNSIKIFPVHRLDRDTSGVLLFATSKEIRERVMAKWEESTKIYLAIVQGKPKVPVATINKPLRLDDKIYKVIVGEHKLAKRAVTHYKVIKSAKKSSLLEVKIDTGRQHQIRAHLAHIGNPIVGDQRYGKKGDKLGLHAKYLKVYHPIKKCFLSVSIDAPSSFYQLLEKDSI